MRHRFCNESLPPLSSPRRGEVSERSELGEGSGGSTGWGRAIPDRYRRQIGNWQSTIQQSRSPEGSA